MKKWLGSSGKEKSISQYDTIGWNDPHVRGLKFRDISTEKAYWLGNDVKYDFDISVKNTSAKRCGENWRGKDKMCWLSPGTDLAVWGGDNKAVLTVTFIAPNQEEFVDSSWKMDPDSTGTSTGNEWSIIEGSFTLPKYTAYTGVWSMKVEFGWDQYDDDGDGDWEAGTKDNPLTWEGPVFEVFARDCIAGASAETVTTYKSEFSRPVFMPAISHQSFMQF